MLLNDINVELNNGSILTLNKSIMYYEDEYIVVRQKKSKINISFYLLILLLKNI